MVYTLASEVNFLEAYPKVSNVEELEEEQATVCHPMRDVSQAHVEEDLEEEQATVCHPMRDVSQAQLGDTMVNTGTPQEGVQEGVQDDDKEKPAVVVHPREVRLKRRTACPVDTLSSLLTDLDFALN